jgi:hypothetical protein
MRYCYHCNHATSGEPLFCNFCGRTYDVKLCPRLHVNPRHAEVCSQCGSRDLSTPQPKVPLKAKAAIIAVTFLLGLLLVLLSIVFAVVFLREIFVNPSAKTMLLGIGIMLGVLWWIWFQIPQWLRKWIIRLIRRRHSRSDK